MANGTEPRRLLSGTVTARRFDISHKRLLKAVESGDLVPAALFDGNLAFDEAEVMRATGDVFRISKIRGLASQP